MLICLICGDHEIGGAHNPKKFYGDPAKKDWKCQECGRRMTLKAAEKASSEGCSKCGSVDIDLA